MASGIGAHAESYSGGWYTTAGQQSTLPIWIFSQLSRPRDRPVTNVVALFVVVITAVPILLAYRLTQERGESVVGQ